MASLWMDIKKDLKWAVLVSAAILGFGFCGDAKAQVTVQPVYIRPSKGNTLSLTVQPSGFTQVLDMSAFSALTVVYGNINYTVENLNQYVRFAFTCPGAIVTWTSASKDSGFYLADTPEAERTTTGSGCNASTPLLITPLPLSPVVRVIGPIREGQGEASGRYPVTIGGMNNTTKKMYPISAVNKGAGPGYALLIDGTVTATSTPAKTNPTLPLVSPVAVAASPGAATQVGFVTSVLSTITLQNMGVWPVACAVGPSDESSLVSTTRYSFMLAAGVAAGDGTGGTFKAEALPTSTYIFCIGSGGASSVATLPQ